MRRREVGIQTNCLFECDSCLEELLLFEAVNPLYGGKDKLVRVSNRGFRP